jgi:hypothetical protein
MMIEVTKLNASVDTAYTLFGVKKAASTTSAVNAF